MGDAVAWSQAVTSMALSFSQAEQPLLGPDPYAHGTALEFAANALGAKYSRVVTINTGEMALPSILKILGVQISRRLKGQPKGIKQKIRTRDTVRKIEE